MNHPLLIDTDTLQRTLGKPELLVIDVRGDAAYEYGGHIPGAVHTTWHNIVIPMRWRRAVGPRQNRMEQKMRALGLNKDSEVVIYSNPSTTGATKGGCTGCSNISGTRICAFWTAAGSNGWRAAAVRAWARDAKPGNFTINRSATRSSPKTNCGRWSSILSPHEDSRRQKPGRIFGKGSLGHSTAGPYSHCSSRGMERILEYQRDGQGSRNHQGRSGRQRTGAGRRHRVLLHGRRPLVVAVFCPEACGLSEGPELSGVLVGMEP